MKFFLKPGVSFEGAEPETFFAMGAFAAMKFFLFPGSDITFTSVKDGVHPNERPGHGHGAGRAFDMRTTDLRDREVQELLAKAKAMLEGHSYFIQYEGLGTPNATAPHLHCQYNPEQPCFERLVL